MSPVDGQIGADQPGITQLPATLDICAGETTDVLCMYGQYVLAVVPDQSINRPTTNWKQSESRRKRKRGIHHAGTNGAGETNGGVRSRSR